MSKGPCITHLLGKVWCFFFFLKQNYCFEFLASSFLSVPPNHSFPGLTDFHWVTQITMQNPMSPMSYFLLLWEPPEAGLSQREHIFQNGSLPPGFSQSRLGKLLLQKPLWIWDELACFCAGAGHSVGLIGQLQGFVPTPHINMLIQFSLSWFTRKKKSNDSVVSFTQ